MGNEMLHEFRLWFLTAAAAERASEWILFRWCFSCIALLRAKRVKNVQFVCPTGSLLALPTHNIVTVLYFYYWITIWLLCANFFCIVAIYPFDISANNHQRAAKSVHERERENKFKKIVNTNFQSRSSEKNKAECKLRIKCFWTAFFSAVKLQKTFACGIIETFIINFASSVVSTIVRVNHIHEFFYLVRLSSLINRVQINCCSFSYNSIRIFKYCSHPFWIFSETSHLIITQFVSHSLSHSRMNFFCVSHFFGKI